MAIRILAKDDIWAAKDIEERDVEIPQWGEGVGVRIRNVTMKQVDDLRTQATHVDRHTKQDVVDNKTFVALLICACVIEPEITLEEYERMTAEKSAVAVAVIQKAVLDVCGLSNEAVADAGKSPEDGPDGEVAVSSGSRIGNDPSGITDANVGKRVRVLDRAVQP